jgi:hypothetical protein
MGFFAGLCTILVLLVTAMEAWQEHAQAQWPEVSASIRQCRVEFSPASERGTDQREGYYYINCGISYLVGSEEIVTNIQSRSTPAPNLPAQDPWATVNRLHAWVNEHPRETPISVHYHPLHLKQAALVATDMPLGGPRTPSNLKLLGIFAAACATLLAIAKIRLP